MSNGDNDEEKKDSDTGTPEVDIPFPEELPEENDEDEEVNDDAS